MSKDKGRQTVKRFFIQGTPDLYRRLRVLAAHFDSGTEKFGAVLLERAIAQAEAEIAAAAKAVGKSKPPQR